MYEVEGQGFSNNAEEVTRKNMACLPNSEPLKEYKYRPSAFIPSTSPHFLGEFLLWWNRREAE